MGVGIGHPVDPHDTAEFKALAASAGTLSVGLVLANRPRPDPKYFDSDKFAIPKLKQVLRAKAVLCPNLRVVLINEASGEKDEWFYTGGLHQYLAEELGKG